MSAKALETTPSSSGAALYQEDFALWAEQTAQLLLERRFSEIAIEELADEVATMARSRYRELDSRLTVLLKHLLKWKCQPEKRNRSWESTIMNQRRELRRLFKESPSVRRKVEESIAEAYPDAVKDASYETRLDVRSFPAVCPFSREQIFDEDFPE